MAAQSGVRVDGFAAITVSRWLNNVPYAGGVGNNLTPTGTRVAVLLLPQLSVVSVRDIGPDYAITLRAWRDAWRVRRADRRTKPCQAPCMSAANAAGGFGLLLQLAK